MNRWVGAVLTVAALAAPRASAQPGIVRLDGILTGLQVDQADERTSAGYLVVDGKRVAVPSTVFVELPGDALTMQELFVRAPTRCREQHESGLVPADKCRRPALDPSGRTRVWSVDGDRTPRTYLDPIPTDEAPPTVAHIEAHRLAAGELVATRVVLTRTDASVWGAVTFVNEEEGYLRINGAFGADEGGALLRINDPEARQSVQSGTGCGGEGNCSPDVRFRASSRDRSVRFDAGYTACIPGGLGAACASTSRPVRALLDGNAMLPIVKGDHLTAQGGFEVYDGVRVFWAHALVVHTSPDAER